jgi:hypothetical protein
MPRRYDRGVRELVILLAILAMGGSGKSNASFDTAVRPILERRCVPCHFAGGKMYAKLPFDRPATILQLGERLFTRIKDENDRRVIRAYLAATRAARS